MNKYLKKIIALVLMTVCCISVPKTVVRGEVSSEIANETEEEVQEIIAELTEMALEKQHAKSLNSLLGETENLNLEPSMQSDEEQVLEELLLEKGMIKVDVNCPESMNLLYETLNTDNGISVCSDIYENAPDLAALASAYTVYVRDWTYSYKGVEQPIRGITVIDNKGANGLYRCVEFQPVEGNITQNMMKSVLEYNFSFLFDAYFGTITGCKYTSWVLGNVFAALEGVTTDNSVICATSDAMYRIIVSSVTTMTYYYCYNGADWDFVGNGATIKYTQTDFLAANVNGNADHIPQTFKWQSNVGYTFNRYAEGYVDAELNNAEFYCAIDPGIFYIQGFSGTFGYRPMYEELPGYLIR